MSKRRILCRRCGFPPERTQTAYGLRLDCCGLWAWGEHPLADRATHEARKAAHAAFDPIWKRGHLSRGEAYRRLAEAMGLSSDECHMKLMTAEQASRVPDIAACLLAEARAQKLEQGGMRADRARMVAVAEASGHLQIISG
jgi:hypothetical protein